MTTEGPSKPRQGSLGRGINNLIGNVDPTPSDDTRPQPQRVAVGLADIREIMDATCRVVGATAVGTIAVATCVLVGTGVTLKLGAKLKGSRP